MSFGDFGLQYGFGKGIANHSDERPSVAGCRPKGVGCYPANRRNDWCVDPITSCRVLATAGTIKSESYPLEIKKLYPDVTVSGKACPMWVPLVENGEAELPGADYFVDKYISELLSQDGQIDTVILGCTHYPLLLPKIRSYMPKDVTIVSQGELVASSLEDYLKRHPEMDAKCTKQGSCRYLTTEAEDKFAESASCFLNEQIKVERITLE